MMSCNTVSMIYVNFFFSRVALVELYFKLELFSLINIVSCIVPLSPSHGFISILIVSVCAGFAQQGPTFFKGKFRNINLKFYSLCGFHNIAKVYNQQH